ncbi:F-box protein SKIP23-like [Pistacia vera]|uniref:F-box protein SKIP23-like n=1 Tax=Pistacia vera TaxID=55513 RepID=UPI00126352FE|nr:F-box protein SKIP23-like [Pistacia vera]
MDNSTTSDWSTLPEDLLISVAKRLHKRIDVLCLRAICKSFRSSIPPPPKPLSPLSLNISIPATSVHHASPGCLELARFTFYAIQPLTPISYPRQSTETWLVKIQELNSGKVRLEDPLSRLGLGNSSNKLYKSRKLPRSFNLLDYRVKEVAKAYRIELVHQFDEPVVFSKAVVSSHDGIDDGFAVMAIVQGNLVVWRNLDKKWSRIRFNNSFSGDIIYHNHKFYAATARGLTVSVDCNSLTVTQVAGPLETLTFWTNLVKSFDDLFVIVKFWAWKDERNDFKVYKLDEEIGEWVEVVDGLEDRAFFLGDDCSFSISAKEFPGCKGNSVYFKHGPFRNDGCLPGTDGGIFDLKDRTVRRLFAEHSKIFWPPPRWVKR